MPRADGFAHLDLPVCSRCRVAILPVGSRIETLGDDAFAMLVSIWRCECGEEIER